jgi:phosphoglycolate phosphatase
MGGAPESAALVGDTETDMAAARGAGISAIAVTYGYCRVPPNRLDADALIDDFRDLPETLRTVFLQRNSCTT